MFLSLQFINKKREKGERECVLFITQILLYTTSTFIFASLSISTSNDASSTLLPPPFSPLALLGTRVCVAHFLHFLLLLLSHYHFALLLSLHLFLSLSCVCCHIFFSFSCIGFIMREREREENLFLLHLSCLGERSSLVW